MTSSYRAITSQLSSMTSYIRLCHVMVWLLTTRLDWSVGVTLAPIHWNASNPMFKASRNDHVIQVNLYDDVDFVCPHYNDVRARRRHRNGDHFEYYVIYQVTRSEYDQCVLLSEPSSVTILKCNHPERRKRYTILFEPFQSIPNAPEFRAGETYYYMSVSTGKKGGMSNLYHGACLHSNLKLTVQVCCRPSTTPLVETTTTTTTTTTVATTRSRTLVKDIQDLDEKALYWRKYYRDRTTRAPVFAGIAGKNNYSRYLPAAYTTTRHRLNIDQLIIDNDIARSDTRNTWPNVLVKNSASSLSSSLSSLLSLTVLSSLSLSRVFQRL